MCPRYGILVDHSKAGIIKRRLRDREDIYEAESLKAAKWKVGDHLKRFQDPGLVCTIISLDRYGGISKIIKKYRLVDSEIEEMSP